MDGFGKRRAAWIFETKIDNLGWLQLCFLRPYFFEKNEFLKTWLLAFAEVFFLDFQDLSFLNVSFDLTLMLEVHCGAKWSIFMKISNKIHFFIPTSFDKFFETGNFEKKTNSVDW